MIIKLEKIRIFILGGSPVKMNFVSLKMQEVEIPPNWSLLENEYVSLDGNEESIGSAYLNALGRLRWHILFHVFQKKKRGAVHLNLGLPLCPAPHPFSWTDPPTHRTHNGQWKRTAHRADLGVQGEPHLLGAPHQLTLLWTPDSLHCSLLWSSQRPCPPDCLLYRF